MRRKRGVVLPWTAFDDTFAAYPSLLGIYLIASFILGGILGTVPLSASLPFVLGIAAVVMILFVAPLLGRLAIHTSQETDEHR